MVAVVSTGVYLPKPSVRSVVMSSHAAADATGDDRDRALLLAAGRGDQAAFAELLQHHQQPVYGFIVRMLGGPSGADDLTQDTFLRLWRAAPKWKPEASVRGYLFLIARRVVFNECRRRKRKPFTSVEQLAEERIHGLERADGRPDAAAQLDRRELWAAIDGAIAELPEQQRMAVVLRRYEDMPYEDIAAALGTSVSSVKSLLWRARTALRESLAGWI